MKTCNLTSKMSNSCDDEDPSVWLMEQLTKCLNDEMYEEALSLLDDEKLTSIVEQHSWEIVPLVSSRLTEHNARCKHELFDCCKSILNILAEKCNPSEIILEILEQVESLDDDAKFCALLQALRTVLGRIGNKIHAVEWCVSTIKSYIDGLPLPENEKPTAAVESENLELDEVTQRITTVYRAILAFLEPSINEIAHISNDTTTERKNYFLSLLLASLGKPLCYLDSNLLNFEFSLKKESPIPEIIVTYATRLTGDLFRFLKIVHDRSEGKALLHVEDSDEETNRSLEVNLFESEENMPSLAYAHLYFLISENESMWKLTPQVYHPHYVLLSCLYLVNCFLQRQEYAMISKGLKMLKNLSRRIDKFSMGYETLELTVHSKLFGSIAQIMIYCDCGDERRAALVAFHEYVELFDARARYLIILRLYETCNHTGLLSLITTIFKDSVIECLNECPRGTHFLGNKMKVLLKRACKLPNGVATDLVEISDEVITALNLLRFLVIRDKSNETGLWDYIDELEATYLKPLREGIDVGRAHWTLKIQDLEQRSKTLQSSKVPTNSSADNLIDTEKLDDEITITVGGEVLPSMPVGEKIKFCHQAINALDVMESILIRVNKCIADKSSILEQRS